MTIFTIVRKTKRVLHSTALFLALSTQTSAFADPGPLSSVIFGESSESSYDIRGWMSQGITFNPASHSSYNGPISFNNRGNEFQMNQFYLVGEKTVTRGGDAFDIGGRIDVMYGTDAAYTMATGWDDNITSDHASRFYKLAIPQAYIEANIPVLAGVSVKAGHFYTPIGYEVVTAPDNFFYSHAYTMQYGEPFTHFGALASTAFNDGKLSFTAGAVRGWDNMSDTADGDLSFIGGFTFAPFESTTIAVTGITGDEGEGARRSMYSTVVTQKLSDSLSYVLQHDFGTQEIPGGGSASWYGLNNYLLYTIDEALSAGLRVEWFKDADGTRVVGLRSGAGGVPASYYGITAGLNYKKCDGLLTLRPELRYDIQDAEGGTDKAFNGGDSRHQVTMAVDAILRF